MAEQADSAAKEGDFPKAGRLYAEHLAVLPDDVEIQIKHADILLKGGRRPNSRRGPWKSTAISSAAIQGTKLCE